MTRKAGQDFSCPECVERGGKAVKITMLTYDKRQRKGQMKKEIIFIDEDTLTEEELLKIAEENDERETEE